MTLVLFGETFYTLFVQILACTNFGGWTNPPILAYFGGTNFGGQPVRVKFGGYLFWWLAKFSEIMPHN